MIERVVWGACQECLCEEILVDSVGNEEPLMDFEQKNDINGVVIQKTEMTAGHSMFCSEDRWELGKLTVMAQHLMKV